MRARDKANGGAIVGTVNTVIATVKLDPESFRVEGGELRADDAGDGARLDWDSMSQKEEDGLLLFVSTDGTHVREDEIELVDEAGNVTNLERTRDQRGLRCDRCGREIAPSDEDRDDEGKLATPVLCGSCRPERPADAAHRARRDPGCRRRCRAAPEDGDRARAARRVRGRRGWRRPALHGPVRAVRGVGGDPPRGPGPGRARGGHPGGRVRRDARGPLPLRSAGGSYGRPPGLRRAGDRGRALDEPRGGVRRTAGNRAPGIAACERRAGARWRGRARRGGHPVRSGAGAPSGERDAARPCRADAGRGSPPRGRRAPERRQTCAGGEGTWRTRRGRLRSLSATRRT